jgi:hypothetical protein
MDDMAAKVADEIIDAIGATTRMAQTVRNAIIPILDNRVAQWKGGGVVSESEEPPDLYSVVRCEICGVVKRSHDPNDHRWTPTPDEFVTMEEQEAADAANIQARIGVWISDLEIVNELIRVFGYERLCNIIDRLEDRLFHVSPALAAASGWGWQYSTLDRKQEIRAKFALPGPPQPQDWECVEHESYFECVNAMPHYMRE